MEKEFLPYEQALELKELGFNEECFKCKLIGQEHLDYTPTDYDDFPEQKEKEVLIPTFSQSFRWFREKYTLHPLIEQTQYDFRCSIVERPRVFYHIGGTFDTYEEAELECLKKLIEIVKNK